MRNLLNFMKNSKVKATIILIFLLMIYTFICALNYVQAVSSNICNSVFRLHVIANSDSKEDQDLKYLVRDNLLKYMNEISIDITTKEEAIALVNSNLDTFKEIALNTIRENGFDYDVNIKVGNFYFPTKFYGDISFPAGMYDALKVEIGKADGQNWWCVMFPSLCFIDVSSGVVENDSKELLENNLSSESYSIVSDNESTEVKFKFKILEFFGSNNLFAFKK
ncbi:MAG: stage II sporulation protein R [Clostridia bacterium]|nr:stage II sporulation protein R [Clostridia bacterium]